MENTQIKTELPLKLMKKLNTIRGEITIADKDQKVDFGRKYTYASFTSLWETVKASLVKNNVYFDVYADEEKDTERPIAGPNGEVIKTEPLCAFTYTLVDLESGESITRTRHFTRCNTLAGIQADGGTQTYALKYILNLAFMIQTAEDPDAIDPNQGNKGKSNNQPKQQYQPYQQPQGQPMQQKPAQAQAPKKSEGELMKEAIAKFYKYIDEGNLQGAANGLAYVKSTFPTMDHQKMALDLAKKSKEVYAAEETSAKASNGQGANTSAAA